MKALPQTFCTIQALRAFAAAAVVYYHVLYMLIHNCGYSFTLSAIGANGVDLFFIISGFIMFYTSYHLFRKPKSAAHFLKRRFIRIAPLYWLCTTLIVLLLLSAPRLFVQIKLSWTNIISSYLFLLSTNNLGEIGTVLQTGWTLCFECYFYLLFALTLNFSRSYFFILLALVFTLGIILGKYYGAIQPWLTVTTDPILFEFYLGTVLAYFYINGFRISRYLAISLLFAGVLALFFTQTFNAGSFSRLIGSGLPCTAIFLGAISLEDTQIKIPKLFVSLGNSSYSLYLVHPLILPAIGKIWIALHLNDRLSPMLLASFAFVSALLAGHVTYLLLEKPLTLRLTSMFGGLRQKTPNPPYLLWPDVGWIRRFLP